MRGWIEWFFKGVWHRRRVWQVVLIVMVLIMLPAGIEWIVSKRRPARTMTDPTFVRAANALCAQEVKPLAEKQRSSQEQEKIDDSPKANAAKVDKVADKLEAAVAHLRALSHRPANNDQLNAWFGAFDDYVKAGRDYAAALRTGNETEYNKVDDEGVAPLKAISHFARANRIDNCIP
ncbi:MAG TPA: hypothetical protein VHC63_17015 [Acidimicrobiales bacterium]|nr:hypothetical protein [Acidimicrobiales bacterium]